MELVAAERADEQDGHVPQGPNEVGDGLAGRAVGPVQVLDDQQHRRSLAEPLEQAEERLEQAGLHPFRLGGSDFEGAECRHEASQVAGRGSCHGCGLCWTEL